MIAADLIERLQQLANAHGWECRVEVVTTDGPWPFTLDVEPDYDGSAQRMVFCLRVTRPSRAE